MAKNNSRESETTQSNNLNLPLTLTFLKNEKFPHFSGRGPHWQKKTGSVRN
jgi:hypothetical protein